MLLSRTVQTTIAATVPPLSKYFMLLLISFILSCTDASHQEHRDWRQKRLNDLLQPYAWPSVIGLYPIEDSITYIGRFIDEGIIHDRFPDTLGFIQVSKNGEIFCKSVVDNAIYIDDIPIIEAQLRSDRHGQGPSIATYKSFQWYVIDREGKLFVRLKDSLSTYRKNLNIIPSYPFNEEYTVKAHVKKGDNLPKIVRYKNMLGQNLENKIAAILEFEWAGELHELIALPNTDESYFIILNDKTSGIDTYGGGRFLYPKVANSQGEVILDFNKLINPPCVFTPFATCPLPPKENHLNFEILAGEKDLHLY